MAKWWLNGCRRLNDTGGTRYKSVQEGYRREQQWNGPPQTVDTTEPCMTAKAMQNAQSSCGMW
eukprot:9039448-Prorocentrum_lima.AAC.1